MLQGHYFPHLAKYFDTRLSLRSTGVVFPLEFAIWSPFYDFLPMATVVLEPQKPLTQFGLIISILLTYYPRIEWLLALGSNQAVGFSPLFIMLNAHDSSPSSVPVIPSFVEFYLR